MAILKVARMGHPVLRQKGRDLTAQEVCSPEIKRLVEDMVETMAEYGGIGLAAPQVHQSLQLAIIGFDAGSARYPGMGEQDLLVLFNPKITVLSQELQAYWEGCLSVPGLRGLVKRPGKIQVDYLDADAKPQHLVAEGFLATVFQHELDHLAGVLYIDRIESGPGRTPLAFQEEYLKYLVPREDDEAGELPD